MILLITGNGKGKTTSALGQALRAVGDGKKVLMVQFIKSPALETGELIASRRLEPDFKLVAMGRGFVGIWGDMLPREEHAKAAAEALDYARDEMRSRKWNFIILDEVNVALSLNLISLDDVMKFLDEIPHGVDVMFTGRLPAGRQATPLRKALLDRADVVSEVQEIKHPFAKGKIGKRGIEY